MRSFSLLFLAGALSLACSHDLEDVSKPGADLAGVDGKAPDLPSTDAIKADAAKADAAKTDAAKTDAAKTDAAKTDAAKTDLAKVDAVAVDATKKDATKPDLAKLDSALPDGPSPDIAGCNKSGKVDNPGEECDGKDFAGETCITQGFDYGDLTCTACKIVTTSCIKHEWKLVPAGTFNSGSVGGDTCYPGVKGDYRNENIIKVKLTRPFWISAKEVTVGQYKAVMNASPSANTSCGSNCPVENVTWAEAAAYCNALSKAQGLEECYACTGTVGSNNMSCPSASGFKGGDFYKCAGYRLPSEVEWEKAYRTTATGGIEYKMIHNGNMPGTDCTNSKGSYILSKIGHNKPYSSTKKPVGKLTPNGMGIYDMSGNVYEWIQDWHMINRQKAWGSNLLTDIIHNPAKVSYRGLRGGSYKVPPWRCRASHRWWMYPTTKASDVGFRCVKQWCVWRVEEFFSSLTKWKSGSLIRVANAGTTTPVLYNKVYVQQTINNKEGGHHIALPKAITLRRFLVQAKMTADSAKKTARASVGVHTGTTLAAATGGTVGYGTGYACNWEPNKGQVSVTRLDGAKGETVVASASGLTKDSKPHTVSCARKLDGTWEIKVDGNAKILGLNKKDLTHLKLTHASLLLSADSTDSALDDVYVRDCN